MTTTLTAEQAQAQKEFRAFADLRVAPYADARHRAQRTLPRPSGCSPTRACSGCRSRPSTAAEAATR